MLEEAGFTNVEFVGWTDFRTAPHTRGATFSATRRHPHMLLGGSGK